MTDLNPDLLGPQPEGESRDPAVSAFLYLGEKLRSFYQRERRKPAERSELPPEGADTLIRAIEGEIIPRLLLAHEARPELAGPDPTFDPSITPEEKERFLGVLMSDSAASTRRFCDMLLERGVTHETLFLDLLADCARRLGELWEDDRISFTEVTIGLCRLHQVLREQSAPGPTDTAVAGGAPGPGILLATACGDQHVFGVVMVAEFFRRASWRVWSEPGASRSEIEALLADQHFDLLGLSAACSTLADAVAEDIDAFRRASRNRDLKVLVGGRLFVDEPELTSAVGADGAAFDAKAAPAAGNALLELQPVLTG